jgi:hypothetical protein
MEPYTVVINKPPFCIDSMMENGIHIVTSYRSSRIRHMYDWIALWERLRLFSNQYSTLLN